MWPSIRRRVVIAKRHVFQGRLLCRIDVIRVFAAQIDMRKRQNTADPRVQKINTGEKQVPKRSIWQIMRQNRWIYSIFRLGDV